MFEAWGREFILKTCSERSFPYDLNKLRVPGTLHTTDPGFFGPPPPAAAPLPPAAAPAIVVKVPKEDPRFWRRSCRVTALILSATSSLNRAFSASSCWSVARCRRRMAWASSLYVCGVEAVMTRLVVQSIKWHHPKRSILAGIVLQLVLFHHLMVPFQLPVLPCQPEVRLCILCSVTRVHRLCCCC